MFLSNLFFWLVFLSTYVEKSLINVTDIHKYTLWRISIRSEPTDVGKLTT